MKFLVDMPLSPELAAWLRGQGHDAAHVADLGLSQASDVDLMALARREGRTIVTADLDYPRLLALARETDPSLIRDGNWSDTEVIRRLDWVLRALTADDLAASVIVVDRDRVRRRRLPVEP